jgi:hypothetical protein
VRVWSILAHESGMVSIVPHGPGLPEIPSGFIKDSGFGGEGGAQALAAFFATKSVALLAARGGAKIDLEKKSRSSFATNRKVLLRACIIISNGCGDEGQ